MVLVPTLNAAGDLPSFLPALLDCVPPGQILLVDSQSTDGTQAMARAYGVQVVGIGRHEFNHGGTRQLAVQLAPDADIVVFLTQDVTLKDPDAIRRLVEAFDHDPYVGAAYGRQLPRNDSGPIESHARLFNYPGQSSVRSLEEKDTLGIKSIFLSNSFAAYRRTALEQVGGFPVDVILGEDTITAARLLLRGWTIHYVAEAQAYHSHAYSYWRQFQRYFDTGVLHARESWMQEQFGAARGEGKRFVLSELSYLWPRHALLIPSALLRTALKLIAYRLGRIEHRLSRNVKSRLSMHHSFWQ